MSTFCGLTRYHDGHTHHSRPTATRLAHLISLLPATTQHSDLMMATLPSTSCTFSRNIERLDAEEPPYNLWFDLFNFATEWDLELSILPYRGMILAQPPIWFSTHPSVIDSRRETTDPLRLLNYFPQLDSWVLEKSSCVLKMTSTA